MTNRYYDPGTGRFLTRDPIGTAGGINLYGFVHNDPITHIDPNGTQDPYGGGDFSAYLSWSDNAAAYTTPSDWWNTFKHLPIVRALGTALNIITSVPDPVNPVFDAKVVVWTGEGLKVALEDGVKLVAEASAPKTTSLWTPAEVAGVKVYQRSDLIDPTLIDETGLTNLERMTEGKAPLGPDGKPINLHHMLQTDDGPIAETTQTFHQRNHTTLHINGNDIPSGINRTTFNSWRKRYWMSRARDFHR